MLTDVKIRNIKPSEKKARYSDEKGMYLEVTHRWHVLANEIPF